jgi:diguanylate cyclase (GGDEF)-like protein
MTLDNFDAINEKFGQVIADRALRAFVSRLKKSLGPYDVGGCYDGARFISITDVDVRFKTIEFTCAKLAQELSFDVNFDAVALGLTSSIGAAIYPLNGRTIADVLTAAELALKSAKARGMPYVIAEGAESAGQTVTGDPRVDTAPAPSVEEATSAEADCEPTSERRRGDRRSVARQRVLKRGQIVMPDLCSAVDCTIRDISPRGARLRVEGLFIAPDQFDLVFVSTGEKRRTARRWQKGNEFGVEFVD